ncbi:MAG: DNA polymerase III subunit delta, partial [Gemmatimonadota bacterium]|nr:DNA polymerase III subunit delta [Gemmatimonadota bacterium]
SLADSSTARDFNFDRFHGLDLETDRLSTALNTIPMMAARRVVLVRGLERASPKAREYLAGYAAKPSNTTVLVLAAGERIRIDKKKRSPKWAAALEESAETVQFWPLKEEELIDWLISRASERGKQISRQGAFELYGRAGSDLARLDDELEKLSIFCGDRTGITSADICQVAGLQSEGTVFDWIDALAEGRILESGRLCTHLGTRGESAVGAIHLAGMHFMRLERVREMLGRGLGESAVKAKLRLNYLPREAARKIFSQARGLTLEKLARALELLLETDLKLKSSKMADRLILEDLGFSLQQEVFG